MDYYDSPQIGGYRIEMPFPQLFYPEINSVNKLFYQSTYSDCHNEPRYIPNSQFGSDFYDSGCKPNADFSRDAPNGSPFQSDFYDSGCKDNVEVLRGSCNMGYRPQPRNNRNDPIVYNRNSWQSRRAREMLLRNGLFAPNDDQEMHSMYPQYEGDPMEQPVSRTSMWQ